MHKNDPSGEKNQNSNLFPWLITFSAIEALFVSKLQSLQIFYSFKQKSSFQEKLNCTISSQADVVSLELS